MFIGQFAYLHIVHGANDLITVECYKNQLKDEYRAETLKEVQQYFWDVFHKNKGFYGNFHSFRFISGQITDTDTGKTWACDSYGRKTKGGITMALPTYDKSKRRKTIEHLPKGAYVVKILRAKEETGSYGQQVAIYFDIAEGEHRDFYNKQYEANTNEDKNWPYDAVFYLTVPNDGCADWIWTKWNTFFGDLEDSNNGFVFDGDLRKLKGKLIGGVFHIKQSAKGDKVYSNTKMKWSCVAEDVRKGKITRFPDDVIVQKNAQTVDDFVNLPDGTDEKAPWE